MTSREVFNQCVSLMFGEAADRADYEPFWTDALNLILAENFELNNALREAAGKAALKEPPYIESFEQETGAEPQLERILPLAGAGYLFLEDEPQTAAYYAARFESLKETIFKAQYTDSYILPVY